MNNNNQKLPRYVESDISKAKITIPPRNRKREVDIYMYDTNMYLDTLHDNKNAIAIQTKLKGTIKAQITTPLNFDIAKPKFANISESAVWGTQINGIIYNELQLSTEKYSFFCLSIADKNNIKNIFKYRIINLDPIYDNKNRFIYATFNAVVDSSTTIISWKKITWNVVNEFQADKKTKYIKIEFDERMQIFANSLKISVKPSKNSRPRNDGYNINGFPDLVLKLIKIRGTFPYEFDDLTLGELNVSGPYMQLAVEEAEGNWNTIKTNEELSIGIKAQFSTLHSQLFTHEPKLLKYFSRGLSYNYIKGKDGRRYTLRKMILSENNIKGLTGFLNGTTQIDGQIIPNKKNLIIETDHKKTTDLKITNENDRSYFVATKRTDLLKLNPIFKYDEQATYEGYIDKQAGLFFPKLPKLNLIAADEISKLHIDDKPVILEIELQASGFNPKIQFDVLGAETVKITSYDKDHNIIGPAGIQFDTEFRYDDSKKHNEIQL